MFNLLLEKIKKYDTIIIHGHIRPDGDCYGSQFGLKEIIKTNFKSKNVYVVGEITKYVSFLGTPDVIQDNLYENSLAIAVDTGAADRLSDQRFFTAKEFIKIDHHIAVDSYGQINIVDELSPACAQIITEFALETNLVISYEAAFALYTGIVTDTGRYRHGITHKTFNIAAELISLGVDAKKLDNLLSVETLNVLKLKGYVLSNFINTPEGVAYAKLPLSVIEEFEVSQEEASNQVGVIGSIESCPVYCLFIENNGQIRGRLRSRGPEIDKIANKYNGGGHKMACGVTLESFDDIKTLIEDLNNLVKKFKG